MNTLEWFLRFALLGRWRYVSITKSSTFTESFLAPFPALKCAKDKANQRQKIFVHLAHFVFSEAVSCPVLEFVLSEEHIMHYASLASLLCC